MNIATALRFTLFPAMSLAASCGQASGVESDGAFTATEHDTFSHPWAAAFVPGTSVLMITEKGGTIRGYDTSRNVEVEVDALIDVDLGGQGGLGDVAFLPSEAANAIGERTIFLSWVEAGDGDTRGAVVGRGRLDCPAAVPCTIEELSVIWRQVPKVTGRGHFSHRLLISPDEQFLYVSSGDRQKMGPAQDISNTLGTVVRLQLDGSSAPGNPFAKRGSPSDEIWSIGHRNVLGLDFDAEGRLWDIEHGPRGGDELNLVKPGQNYGWPVASNGVHYSGAPIPDHDTRPDLAAPAIWWTPVIGPGDLHFYRGDRFEGWQGNALIAGMMSRGIVRVAIDGESAREVARYDFGERIRSITEAEDGSLWVLEDGSDGRLLHLTPGG